MSIIIPGEVLAETLNVQVVKKPKGEESPRYVVLHLQTDQCMSLLDALTGNRAWRSFIPTEEDKAAIESCRKYLKLTLASKAKREKKPNAKSALWGAVSALADAPPAVPPTVPSPEPTPMVTAEEVAIAARVVSDDRSLGYSSSNIRFAVRAAVAGGCSCNDCVISYLREGVNHAV